MYCINCGKHIEEDSVFCQFCGYKVAHSTYSSVDSPDQESTSSAVNKNASDQLWEKFAEIYDAKDGEKEKYDRLSSEHIWELIDRLYTNAFESFIKEKQDELNPLPYKVIESLKILYLYSVVGGYKLWVAETLLKDKPLGKFKSFNIDEFVDEWKNYDFQLAMKGLSDEVSVCMTMYLEHRIKNFIDSEPDVKELSAKTIEDLKSSIIFQIINGYLAGEVEYKFSK